MIIRKLIGCALMGFAIGASVPAMAAGPGVYSVKGNNGHSDADYSGTLTIVQTSKDTFKLTWIIGNERYEGFGVGDEHVLAVSFTTDGASGTALIVEDDENEGGYNSIWAFKGQTKLGVEVITPKN